MCTKSNTNVPRVDVCLVVPACRLYYNCRKANCNAISDIIILGKHTDVSSVDCDIESLADMLTLCRWGESPCLGTRQLGLPYHILHSVNLQHNTATMSQFPQQWHNNYIIYTPYMSVSAWSRCSHEDEWCAEVKEASWDKVRERDVLHKLIQYRRMTHRPAQHEQSCDVHARTT